jgi:hypothetical protein
MSAPNPLFAALFGPAEASANVEAAPLQLPQSGDWPRTVPSAIDALNVLTGVVAAPPSLSSLSERIAQSLGSLAREALTEHHREFDTSLLLGSIAARWRIGAAKELRPQQTGPVDTGALEQLLTDADHALAGLLQLGPEASAEVRALFNAERGALAHSAVALAQAGAEGSKAAAAQAASAATAKYQRMTQRVTVYTSALVAGDEVAGRARMRRRIVYGAGLAVMGSLSAYQFLQTSQPLPPTDEPAAGAIGTGKASGEAVQFVHTIDGKPFDPATLASLKAQAEASGKVLRQLGAGEVLIETKPPGKKP